MNAASISRAEFFATIARSWMRSKITWIIAALGAAGLAVALAIACWELRSILAMCVSVCLVYGGLYFAWELLPFSERTRARWAHQRALAERYPSYRWRKGFWIGLALFIWTLLGACTGRQVETHDLVFPTILIVLGAAANWVWQKRHAGRVEDIAS